MIQVNCSWEAAPAAGVGEYAEGEQYLSPVIRSDGVESREIVARSWYGDIGLFGYAFD